MLWWIEPSRSQVARVPDFEDFSEEDFRTDQSEWNPLRPEVAYVKLPYGWATLNERVTYRTPLWKISRSDLLTYRELPNRANPKIRWKSVETPYESIALVFVDTNRMYTNGDPDNPLHEAVIKYFGLPKERVVSGDRMFRTGEYEEEGVSSSAYSIGKYFRRGLFKCHLEAINWALEAQIEPYPGCEGDYGI